MKNNFSYQSQKNRVCKACGAKLKPDDSFCMFCGSAVQEETMKPQETTGAPTPINDIHGNGSGPVYENTGYGYQSTSKSSKVPVIIAVAGGVVVLGAVVLVAVNMMGRRGTTSGNNSGGIQTITPIEQNFPYNVTFNEETQHHYAVYDYTDEGLAKDFNAWEYFCEQQGGHLAVINDDAENDFIYGYLRSQGYKLAFFGYTDQYSEGDWQWVDGDTSNYYTNWAPGQPNNGANNADGSEEHYAQFYKETADGRWNDSKIAVNSYKFVCEWDY